jgi:dihydroorotate dehydrogenase (NAD+) catalytic subunit
MVDLRVKIGALELANPVMPASGTFAEGLASVIPFERLGAFVTKTITAELRGGNPTPRVAEVGRGMLNSIGLPSRGLEYFFETTLPFYREFSSPLVVSISAPSAEAFGRVAAQLERPGIAAIEANISCPNLEEDGKAFALCPKASEAVMRHMRAGTSLPIWVKLSPNATDIATIAGAVEAAGADALVVGNTILGMAIDVESRKPVLGSVMGGLSGEIVKPIVLRMTYQCARAVSIPVIGCGGIASAEDAVEYMLAGASAVQVGTATFVQPTAMLDVMKGIAAYCDRKGIARVTDLIGAVEVERQIDNAAIVV